MTWCCFNWYCFNCSLEWWHDILPDFSATWYSRYPVFANTWYLTDPVIEKSHYRIYLVIAITHIWRISIPVTTHFLPVPDIYQVLFSNETQNRPNLLFVQNPITTTQTFLPEVPICQLVQPWIVTPRTLSLVITMVSGVGDNLSCLPFARGLLTFRWR